MRVRANVMNPRRRAMSLFELTIVMFVLGLLAAVTAPLFSDSLRTTRLEAAARTLAAHVKYIRSVAINEGRTTTLVCDTNSHTYWCQDVDFPDRFGVPMRVELRQDYDPTIVLEANFDSANSLSFDLEGTPRVGSAPLRTGTIVLRSGEDQYTVEVAAGSGAIMLTHVDAIGSGGSEYAVGFGEFDPDDFGMPIIEINDHDTLETQVW